MEAADDISYCVADLEDAVENVFLAQNSSISIFTTGSHEKGSLFSQVSEAERGRSVFMYLRVNTLNKLVPTRRAD